MSFPLYDVIQQAEPHLTNTSHYGLWFERFFNQYDRATSNEHKRWLILEPHKDKKKNEDESRGKAYWLNTFAGKKIPSHKEGEKALQHYAENQIALVKTYLKGKCLSFKATGHFVTGMGNPHPVENGFAWHPTLGVPYLTGAAVKGLVRSYLESNLEIDDQPKKQLLLSWFGSTSKDPLEPDYEAQAGTLIFFDAIPTEPVTLGVDVMTPHMGKWYSEGAKKPNQADTVPADWHNPIPITFLVAKEISLLFSFALRPSAPLADKEVIQLDDVAYVLEQALLYAGAGGKTATGYGQMQSLEAIEKAKQQEALKNADVVEGYLKRNLKNKALIVEYQRNPIATLTNQDKIAALLAQLDSATQQKLAKGEPVKMKVYVMSKEIIQLVL
jgi:CRISPR-associated protein Cmr6